MILDEKTLHKACTDTIVRKDHEALLQSIAHVFSDKDVSLASTKDEWYRVGGLVDESGKQISENLRDWVESQEVDDILGLYESFGTDPLYVTRIIGKTLYLVVPTGEDPLSYIQLEVDEVQEVMDRPLFDEENIADDFEELIDPIDYKRVEPRQIAVPRYVFRNARNMFDLKVTINRTSTFKRFYEEWKASSAQGAGHFSNYWVLNFSKHKGAFGEVSTEITPKSRQLDLAPEINLDEIEPGQSLGRAIHDFDREVGYPMAWYFFMLTSKKNFHKLAEMVHDDLMGEYAYLPAKDLKILKGWIADPYCF